MQIEVEDKKNNWRRILDAAIYIGKRLLENGAEIHRVEQTIEYICNAYGASQVDVFAIPSMIVATSLKDDDYYTTKIKRIRSTKTDLYKIEQLNKMSRYICENKPSIEEIEQMIHDFDNMKRYLPLLKYLGVVLGCGGFSIFFGGSIRDSIASSIAAIVMALIMFNIRKELNKVLNTLFISAIGGILCVLLCKIHIGEHITFVMIGTIMLQIPGMALSYSFRDLMMDDLLSGFLRFLESILTAVFIVIGFSIAITIFSNDFTQLDTNNHSIFIQILSCAIGSLGFALAFNLNYKYLIVITIGSAIVMGCNLLFLNIGCNLLISTVLASSIATIVAETAARILKAPVIVFLMILIIGLAPGASLYYTTYNIWLGNMSEFNKYLLSTFYVSFGIGAGIVIIMVLRQLIWDKIVNKIKRKCKD